MIRRRRETDRKEEDEEDKQRAVGKGRKGGEQAAAQPGSDYIIALQDLKQGLRRKNTPERSSSRHQANDSDLKNTLKACRITAGLLGSDGKRQITATGSLQNTLSNMRRRGRLRVSCRTRGSTNTEPESSMKVTADTAGEGEGCSGKILGFQLRG